MKNIADFFFTGLAAIVIWYSFGVAFWTWKGEMKQRGGSPVTTFTGLFVFYAVYFSILFSKTWQTLQNSIKNQTKPNENQEANTCNSKRTYCKVHQLQVSRETQYFVIRFRCIQLPNVGLHAVAHMNLICLKSESDSLKSLTDMPPTEMLNQEDYGWDTCKNGQQSLEVLGEHYRLFSCHHSRRVN